MKNLISTGTVIPSNIKIQIAQPQPQFAVQSPFSQSNTQRERGDNPFSFGKIGDNRRGTIHRRNKKQGSFKSFSGKTDPYDNHIAPPNILKIR